MTTNHLEQDIEIAKKILIGRPRSPSEIKQHDSIYPWSNEKIYKYYKYYDLTEKRALTITGSGDHAIYAAAAGAKEIDSIDKNRLAKYYASLKIASLITYDKDSFFSLFDIENKNAWFTNKFSLQDIKEFLNEEHYIFWNEIIKLNFFKERAISFFRSDGNPCSFEQHLNYKELQNTLSQTTINYHDINFKSFTKNCSQKYDAIFLSNISEWDDSKFDYPEAGLKILNPNGVLYDYRKLGSSYSSSSEPVTERIDCTEYAPVGTSEKVLIYRKNSDIYLSSERTKA